MENHTVQIELQRMVSLGAFSETQVPRTEHLQDSAMTPSPSETQAPRNEQLEVQATSAFFSPSETQALRNDQVQLTVAVPSAPVKKSVKMRPGSLNTPRQAFIYHFLFSFLNSLFQYSNIRGLCSIDWCRKNPQGSAAEFKVFYDNLNPDELKVCEQCIFRFFVYLMHLIRGTRISQG